MSFFATAAKGTEGALAGELTELGLEGVREDRGGVHFDGTLEDGARACLWSRVAVRIVAPLGHFAAPNKDALYEGISAIDWSPYLTPKHTLAVRATYRSSYLSHAQYIGQRTKDAIVDQMRAKVGERPSVDLGDPDVCIFVLLEDDRASVYVDLSGQPLIRRGYRSQPLDAPLKETLAAAMLRLSGWDRRTPLVDPMCGSGTIPVEAALWAANFAPGLTRDRFGFERWAMHEEAAARAMVDLREAARAAVRTDLPEIFASDVAPEAVSATLENAQHAGVKLRVEQHGIEKTPSLGPGGQLITDPPYGARLRDEEGVFRRLGGLLKRLSGHRAAILAGTPRIQAAMPLQVTTRHELYNGRQECRLLLYEIP